MLSNILSLWNAAFSPEASRTRADVWRTSPPIVVCDALCAAKVLGQEMQLIHGWLKGQLVQTLLRRAGRLEGEIRDEEEITE